MIRLITILSLIIGIGMFSYSLTLPLYKDSVAANDLIAKSYDIDKSDYYEKESELRTDKNVYMDLGAGITIASVIIFIFLFFAKIKVLKDFKKVKTFNKTRIFILANFLWLLLIPGTYWYYMFRGMRGDYPPFADSVAIPIMTQIPVYLILLIPLNLFLILTTFNTSLPAKVFIKAKHYAAKSILWEIFFSFWILVNLICFVSFVLDGDHISIFVNLFFTYILLGLRAGKINKFHSINASL